MLRKLLMTSFLVFVGSEGPGQLAAGAMITFVFLLANLSYCPYCTDGLNTLQTFSLISQFLTLFCGMRLQMISPMYAKYFKYARMRDMF